MKVVEEVRERLNARAVELAQYAELESEDSLVITGVLGAHLET